MKIPEALDTLERNPQDDKPAHLRDLCSKPSSMNALITHLIREWKYISSLFFSTQHNDNA